MHILLLFLYKFFYTYAYEHHKNINTTKNLLVSFNCENYFQNVKKMFQQKLFKQRLHPFRLNWKLLSTLSLWHLDKSEWTVLSLSVIFRFTPCFSKNIPILQDSRTPQRLWNTYQASVLAVIYKQSLTLNCKHWQLTRHLTHVHLSLLLFMGF